MRALQAVSRCLRLRFSPNTVNANQAAFSTAPDADQAFLSDSEEHQHLRISKPAPSDMNYFGVYKAVLVGQVGFGPFEKILGDGRALILFSVGTSGLIRPKRHQEQMQWHKVAVYPERLREVANKLSKGRRVYVEGNLEMRIFNDNVTGAVKRIREVSVRQNGNLVVLKDKEPGHLTIGSKAIVPLVTNSPLDPCQEDDPSQDAKVLPFLF